jgi:hypothetical protein
MRRDGLAIREYLAARTPALPEIVEQSCDGDFGRFLRRFMDGLTPALTDADREVIAAVRLWNPPHSGPASELIRIVDRLSGEGK